MNTLDAENVTVMTDESGRVVGYEENTIEVEHRRSRGKILLAGGVLGLVGVGFVIFAPELGFVSAIGGVLAGAGSAGMTLLARR